ncbi:MAG: metal ABC transporter ATP-binding protein [Actinobacteria bacterium]|nr:metal ABC transporter ATP-binding protein [Actinomycetota bacterium]
MTGRAATPVVSLRGGALRFGDHVLWRGLDLDVAPGEFVAVLGANGAGKTSLLRAVLGLQPLSEGTLLIDGRAADRARDVVGYIPQQRRVDPLTPMRVRDMVRLGLDGHRWGIARPGHVDWVRAERALERVDALELADEPIGVLSGGEQQRVRIAQALVAERRLVLCDEPLLSLDLASQSTITELIDRQRRDHGSAVLFVTHEINPVLPYVDRVLYLAGGRFRIGTVAEVMTSESLSALYGTPVDVVEHRGRIVVVGAPDGDASAHHDHGDDHDHVAGDDAT